MATSSKRTQALDRLQQKSNRNALDALPDWTHPQVLAQWEDWKLVRDACAGERVVKEATTEYLPKWEGHSMQDYLAFLTRACYFNFSDRTRRALVGTIFRRSTSIRDFPEAGQPLLEKFSLDGTTFRKSMASAALELLTTGRYGALVDLPSVESVNPRPFVKFYAAEDILDWDIGVLPDGSTGPTRIVVREWAAQSKNYGIKHYYWNLRLLEISGGRYVQTLFSAANRNAKLDPGDVVAGFERVPLLIRGRPIDYIPFHLFNTHKQGNAWDVGQAPILEIARLNMSHYQSSAALEHGLFYTATPIYAVERTGDGQGSYKLGAGLVWELEKGATAKLLEFNGNGLKFLENALESKVSMAASLGGRLLGVSTRSTSESDNSLKLKDRNEQTMLLDVVEELDDGAKRLMTWMLDYANLGKPEFEIAHNRDFLFDTIGSREFRVAAQMYKDGALPIEMLHHYLRKGEMIPDHLTVEEFKELLESKESFINAPDVDAKREGYPDAKTKIEVEEAEKDRKSAEKTAEVTAKAAAKAQPAAAGPGAAKPAAKPKAKPKAKPTE